MGYLKNMLEGHEKSVFEHVVYDSGGVERTFAEQLEKNEAVKVYAKLPGWFKVPTPLGTYNPDWAVLVEVERRGAPLFRRRNQGQPFPGRSPRQRSGEDRLRRGALQGAGRRATNPARYIKATKIDDLMAHC